MRIVEVAFPSSGNNLIIEVVHSPQYDDRLRPDDLHFSLPDREMEGHSTVDHIGQGILQGTISHKT